MIAAPAIVARLAGPLAWVGAVALIFAAGVYTGHRHASQAAAAAERAAAFQAAQELARAQGDADAATAALRQQLADQREYAATLQKELSHAPLVVAASGRAGRCAAAAVGHRDGHLAGRTLAPPGSAGADGALRPLPADGAHLPAEAEAAVGADPELSLAAVSLWDSALAGRDVPAGACGPAGAAGTACAAGSGLTLRHAWQNHAANAELCARDRARHQSLIDYIQRRQQRAQGAPR